MGTPLGAIQATGGPDGIVVVVVGSGVRVVVVFAVLTVVLVIVVVVLVANRFVVVPASCGVHAPTARTSPIKTLQRFIQQDSGTGSALMAVISYPCSDR